MNQTISIVRIQPESEELSSPVDRADAPEEFAVKPVRAEETPDIGLSPAVGSDHFGDVDREPAEGWIAEPMQVRFTHT